MTLATDPATWIDNAHLQPGFVRPSLDRPPKQKWANWVKGWQPMSDDGRAAKAYAYGKDSAWMRANQRFKPIPHLSREEALAAQWALIPDRATQAVPVVKRRAGKKLGTVVGVAAVSPELAAALARIAELETARAELEAQLAARKPAGIARLAGLGAALDAAYSEMDQAA